MTRNGKIARLPREVRNQLNRRLQDGELQTRLVEWLNSLLETQSILAAEFDGRPVNEQNLSEWKNGGYKDWQLQQEAIELVRHMDADSNVLNQVSQERVTDLLAQRLAAWYVVAAKALNASNGPNGDGDGEIDLKLLREFCGDIVALRKGDHSAERLKLERERLEFDREQLRKLREEEFQAWAQEHRDELCAGYRTRAEKIAAARKAYFADVDALEAEGLKLPK